MTANTGGKGHMDGKSLFEKVQSMLHEGSSVIADKAPGPQRATSEQWLSAWRELAQSTNGITKDDSRFEPVCEALEKCDEAWEQDNWHRFQQSVDSLKAIMSRSP